MASSKSPYEPIQISAELEAELLKEDHSIKAIKKLTEATGCSVFVAKQWFVEHRHNDQTPCPCCGKSLPTAQAKQCFTCGMDWHDPNHPVRRGDPEQNQYGLRKDTLYVVQLCQELDGGRYAKYREAAEGKLDPNMVFETEPALGSQFVEWGYKYPRFLRLANGEQFGFEDGWTWMTEKEIAFRRRLNRGKLAEPPSCVNGISPKRPQDRLILWSWRPLPPS